jgi:CheY-like chemotaxis protein
MISKQIKVLIVEDEKIVALDTKDMLESLGYSVTAIASFKEEALKKLEETKPDLALLDIRLYGSIAGVEIAEYIRIHHKIPFIYVNMILRGR